MSSSPRQWPLGQRMVKWVAGALLLVNVALLLWALGPMQRVTQPSAVARPDINADSMALVSERPLELAAAVAPQGCLRLGPFAARASVEQAMRSLDALELSYRERTVDARQIRAFRVFLGPFADTAALRGVRDDLTARGIDHYVVRGDDSAQVVSLGLFSQRETADRYVARLADEALAAQTREEMRTLASTYWLEVTDIGVADRRREQLLQIDWGDAELRVREIPCP